MAKQFNVTKVFVFQDQTNDDINGKKQIARGMFYGLHEGKLMNESLFFDDLCDFVLNEGDCDGNPNDDEVKCEKNTTEMAIHRCHNGLVTCDEKKCNCDEMYPWPQEPNGCVVKFICPYGFKVYNRNVTKGSHCPATKDTETWESCNSLCPTTTLDSTIVPETKMQENLPSVHFDENLTTATAQFKTTTTEPVAEIIERVVNILYILMGLSIAILVVAVIIVVTVFCSCQRSPLLEHRQQARPSYAHSSSDDFQRVPFIPAVPNVSTPPQKSKNSSPKAISKGLDSPNSRSI